MRVNKQGSSEGNLKKVADLIKMTKYSIHESLTQFESEGRGAEKGGGSRCNWQ